MFLLLIPLVNAQDYTGVFEIDKNQVQLGDQFTITGTISHNGERLDSGAVVVKLINGETIAPFPATLENGDIVSTGVLTFDSNNNPMPSGNYQVDITLFSIHGDHVFENMATLIVNNQLVTQIDLDKTEIEPGQSISVTGKAEKSDNRKVNGNIRITLGTKDYDYSFEDGTFQYRIKTSDTIKSHEHSIDILVQDEFGNHKQTTLIFNIIPIPTTLEFSMESREFIPEETLSLIPVLYDQAGDVMPGKEIEIRIANPENEIIEEKAKSAESFIYNIPQFAIPGKWKIKASHLDVSNEEEFTVKEVKDIEISLVAQTLIVKNIGNMEYEDHLIIEAIGDKMHTLEKRTYIQPGETIRIDLYKYLPEGSYQINVHGEKFDVDITDERGIGEKASDFFKDITGNVVVTPGSSASKTSFYVFLLIVGSIIIFLARSKLEHSKISKKAREREFERAKKRKEGLLQLKDKVGIKPRRLFGKATESDIKDMKQRILRDIERDKERRQPYNNTYTSTSRPVKKEFDQPIKKKDYIDLTEKKEDSDDNKGFFNMFD